MIKTTKRKNKIWNTEDLRVIDSETTRMLTRLHLP